MNTPQLINPQADAWAGDFGNDYHKRSPGNVLANVDFFRNALRRAGYFKTVLELGAGTGANIRALKTLFWAAKITAVELNQAAALKLASDNPAVEVIQGNVTDNLLLHFPRQWDIVITKGLLIHIPPQHLPEVYDTIHRACASYILIAEYYNPKPVNVEYRGQVGLLWKRDFAGDMLDRFPDLELVDYGFTYHRDQRAPQDDLTWFLMRKKG